jgi:hypothetical protein
MAWTSGYWYPLTKMYSLRKQRVWWVVILQQVEGWRIYFQDVSSISWFLFAHAWIFTPRKKVINNLRGHNFWQWIKPARSSNAELNSVAFFEFSTLVTITLKMHFLWPPEWLSFLDHFAFPFAFISSISNKFCF